MQIYTDPSRESDPHALPDAEVFHANDWNGYQEEGAELEPGFYWWSCFPGCIPDSDVIGPFETEDEAISDAQEIS